MWLKPDFWYRNNWDPRRRPSPMCGSCAGGSLARHGFQAGGACAFKRVGMAARVLVFLLLQRLGGTSGHAAAVQDGRCRSARRQPSEEEGHGVLPHEVGGASYGGQHGGLPAIQRPWHALTIEVKLNYSMAPPPAAVDQTVARPPVADGDPYSTPARVPKTLKCYVATFRRSSRGLGPARQHHEVRLAALDPRKRCRFVATWSFVRKPRELRASL